MKNKITILFLLGALMAQTSIAQVLSADFLYTWSWASVNEILVLDNTEGNYDVLSLDMGDGTIYNTTDVNHTYTANGTYFITLNVSNSATGVSDSKTIPVVIPSIGCNIAFSYEATGNPGEFIFSPVNGYIFPPSGTVTWDFGDGTTATGFTNQTHTFEDPNASYEVTVTFDGASCDFTYSEVVEAGAGADCFADFTYEAISGDGMTIQFSDASFTASGAPPSAVEWYFGENDNPPSTELNPTYTYYDNGNYLVRYIIYDEVGNCIDEKQIGLEVNGTPPLRANFFYVQPNFNNSEFQVVIIPNFTGNITSIEVDMGDGSPILAQVPDLYIYPTFPATYEICITVYDDPNNLSDTYCLPIIVPWTGCNAIFITEQQEDPTTVKFTALYGSQPLPFVTYFWDFGDGSPVQTTTDAIIFHTFPEENTEYQVVLNTEAANGLGEVFCTFNYTKATTTAKETVTSQDEIISSDDLYLFPNPSDGQFFIKAERLSDRPFQLQIFDVAGALIWEEQIATPGAGLNTYAVDLPQISSGVYLISINDGLQQRTKKLFIR
jgi:PKD repeat protein